MSKKKLEYAMKKRINHLVLVEKRPCCVLDFLDFEVDGEHYSMARGTFRNKISKLVRNGNVELQYYSGLAFYSLKGVNFTKHKPMTQDRRVVTSMSSMSSLSSNFIDNLPADQNAVHDIRFRFKVEGIWSIISAHSPEFPSNETSKDIFLNPLNVNELKITTTVHHTDTVSVAVACSMNPVIVDGKGIIRLSNALTRVEERLLRLVEVGVGGPLSLSSKCIIPDHNTWIVTMWHFGVDQSSEYAGKKFEKTWEDGENAMLRIYSKAMNGKTVIRKERQEYPNVAFEQAMEEKLTIVKT
jgi:hypothetical protein